MTVGRGVGGGRCISSQKKIQIIAGDCHLFLSLKTYYDYEIEAKITILSNFYTTVRIESLKSKIVGKS